jgi:hypothetical protein
MWGSAGKQGEGGQGWNVASNTKASVYPESNWMTDGKTGLGGRTDISNGFIRIRYLGD